MNRNICLGLFLLTLGSAFSQNYVHRVLILNEGYFDFGAQQQVIAPSLGSYDPGLDAYTEVATIPGARFASDVKVGQNAIFIAADTLLLKYDKDNYQLLAQETVQGIRKIALWNGQVLITKGELGGLPEYFESRSTSDLSLTYTITPTEGLMWSCEDIHVENDVAYLAIGNAFDWTNLVGKIGLVDLLTQQYQGDIDLGPNGLNPENIMVRNGTLFTLNNKDFTSSSISTVDMATQQWSATQDIALNSGCAASVMADDHIYYQEYSVGKLARFDLNSLSIADTMNNTSSYYGLIDDMLNGVLYASTTDFISQGQLLRMAYDGTILNTTAIGVAAGNMALDIRSLNGIEDFAGENEGLRYNAATSRLFVENGNVVIHDLEGRLVMSKVSRANNQIIDLAFLPDGVYLASSGREVLKFVK